MNIIQINVNDKTLKELFGSDLILIGKIWKSENEFANSPEVLDIFDGFQANYRPLQNGLKFHMGFEMNGKIYHAYDLKGQTLIKQVKLGGSLHNGGVYQIRFIQSNEGLYASLADKNSYDFHKVVQFIEKNGEGVFSGSCFIDVYDI